MSSTKYREIIYKQSARGLTKPMNNFRTLKVHLTLLLARQHQRPLQVRGELQPQDMFLDTGNLESQNHDTLEQHNGRHTTRHSKC